MNSQIPPQDLSAEAALLGACILDDDAFDIASQAIDTPMVYAESNQRVWDALKAVRAAGRKIDEITVCDQLAAMGLFAEVGGAQRIAELMAAVPVVRHVDEYCEIIRDRYFRRLAINAASSIMRQMSDPTTDTEQVLHDAESKIHTALEGGRQDTVSSAEDVLLDYLSPAGQTKIQPIPTTWADLDSIIGGFTPGQLVIVAARTSAGKTACVTSFGPRIVEAGYPGLFVTYEMSKLEIAERLLLPRINCSLKTLRASAGDPAFRSVMVHHASMLGTLKLFMDESKPSLPQLLATLRMQVRRNGIRFAVIDYLQLIPFAGKAGNREQEIAQMTRQLKAAAGQLGIVIIALSQLNRGVEQRDDKRPRLSDLRESGAIEQDADVVLLLWRPNMPSATNGNQDLEPDDFGEMIVAKQRGGQLGVVKLSWDGKTMTYRDRGDVDYAFP